MTNQIQQSKLAALATEVANAAKLDCMFLVVDRQTNRPTDQSTNRPTDQPTFSNNKELRVPCDNFGILSHSRRVYTNWPKLFGTIMKNVSMSPVWSMECKCVESVSCSIAVGLHIRKSISRPPLRWSGTAEWYYWRYSLSDTGGCTDWWFFWFKQEYPGSAISSLTWFADEMH